MFVIEKNIFLDSKWPLGSADSIPQNYHFSCKKKKCDSSLTQVKVFLLPYLLQTRSNYKNSY